MTFAPVTPGWAGTTNQAPGLLMWNQDNLRAHISFKRMGAHFSKPIQAAKMYAATVRYVSLGCLNVCRTKSVISTKSRCYGSTTNRNMSRETENFRCCSRLTADAKCLCGRTLRYQSRCLSPSTVVPSITSLFKWDSSCWNNVLWTCHSQIPSWACGQYHSCGQVCEPRRERERRLDAHREADGIN